jgi:hypothetical protein
VRSAALKELEKVKSQEKEERGDDDPGHEGIHVDGASGQSGDHKRGQDDGGAMTLEPFADPVRQALSARQHGQAVHVPLHVVT